MFPAATAVTVVRNVARRGVFSHFCLCVQVLLSLATLCHGLPRSAVTEARRRYGLSRMVLRFLTAYHVLLRPLTFCYVAIKFCYVYQVLSTMKHGR